MKTYVFFIGGTGVRVLRSLTMLLASGVEIGLNNELVPIIIDYDSQNGDLQIAEDLMKDYCSLHQIGKYEKDDNKGFFSAKVANDKSYQIVNVSVKDNKETFAKFIDYGAVSDNTKALLGTLYSDYNNVADSEDADKDGVKELHLNLSVGFQGNPNIGTVVFSDYFNDPRYENFVNSFNEGDRVFIVGSIFGGTGSSGFPQLVKKFRQAGSSLNKGNSKALKEAPVGGCIVLPYFKVKPKADSSINSMTFNSKAKAALTYYGQEINNMMDEIYYVGCPKSSAAYDNIIGGTYQKNDAHVVELIAAMSIVEFANRENSQWSNKENKKTDQNGLKCYEFSVKPNDLGDESYLSLFGTSQGNTMDAKSLYSKYVYHLNSFAFFAKYCQDNIYTTTEQGGWFRKKVLKPKDDGASYYKAYGQYINGETNFGGLLNKFEHGFIKWTEEFARNSQFKFNPYDFNGSIENLLNIEGTTTSLKGKRIESMMCNVMDNEQAKYKGSDQDGEKIFLRIGTMAGEAAADIINNN